MYMYKVQHACVLCVSMSKQIYIVLVHVWNIHVQPKFWSFMDIIILVREYNYQLRLQSQTGLKIH